MPSKKAGFGHDAVRIGVDWLHDDRGDLAAISFECVFKQVDVVPLTWDYLRAAEPGSIPADSPTACTATATSPACSSGGCTEWFTLSIHPW